MDGHTGCFPNAMVDIAATTASRYIMQSSWENKQITLIVPRVYAFILVFLSSMLSFYVVTRPQLRRHPCSLDLSVFGVSHRLRRRRCAEPSGVGLSADCCCTQPYWLWWVLLFTSASFPPAVPAFAASPATFHGGLRPRGRHRRRLQPDSSSRLSDGMFTCTQGRPAFPLPRVHNRYSSAGVGLLLFFSAKCRDALRCSVEFEKTITIPLWK